MKILLSLIVVLTASATCLADIHMPPASDQGPTRKFSRGLSNLAFGLTEIPYQWVHINETEGNSAAWSYGLVRGVTRTVNRFRYGVQEVILFPFPVNKGTYTPPYPDEALWNNAGYTEFPPELSWNSKYDWCR